MIALTTVLAQGAANAGATVSIGEAIAFWVLKRRDA